MDDLPDDFAQYSEDYSDQHVNETYTDVAEVPRMDFWVNGVLHTTISISGIISMSQPIDDKILACNKNSQLFFIVPLSSSNIFLHLLLMMIFAKLRVGVKKNSFFALFPFQSYLYICSMCNFF